MRRKTDFSRRDFLKGTSAGVVGAAVLGGWGNTRVRGANDRIRVGVLGSGGRARSIMRILNQFPESEIVAVCDVYEPHREAGMKLAAGDAQAAEDYRRVLDRKDVDAVLIGTPDHWHKQMVIDSVSAGKDCYLEKPIMHSIEEGVEIVRAVEESRSIVQTGTQQRSWEHYILGKHLVDSGKLGKITYIHTYWYQNYLRWMADSSGIDRAKLDWKRWLGPAPDQAFEAEKFRWWRHYWDFGGGILTDLLTHWIDVIQWYMNQPAPTTATSTAQTYIFKWECPDAVTSTLEFPGNFMVTFTGAYNSAIDDGGIEFRGSQATLKIDRAHLAVYSEDARWEAGTMAPQPEVLVRSERDGTIDHVKNFLECVRSRKTPTAPIQAGFEAARTGWLANIALKRGGKMSFDASSSRVAT